MVLKEFKEFAMRGNVIDLAVGVIIGGAFGKIVSSLVNDVLMPVIGVILSGINVSDLKYILKPASGDIPEVAILYGSFIQSIVDFLIIAFSIFLFIKLLSSLKRKRRRPHLKPAESLLLEEIRILKRKTITLAKQCTPCL